MQRLQDQATDLLTAEQVGEVLGIDVSTVYRMAGDGRLRAIKVGRQWRFPDVVVEDLLARPASAAEHPLTPGGPAPRPPDLRSAHVAVSVAADLLGVMMVVTDMAGRPLTTIANPCPRMAALADDPDAVAACAAEWRGLAAEADLQPRFRLGALGFECARSFVRSADSLVAMVLAGGIAPNGCQDPDLFTISAEHRQRVLEALPRVAAALSIEGSTP